MRHTGASYLLPSVTLITALTVTAARADTFNLKFDVDTSLVGTGTFSYGGHLSDGTYLVDTLPGYTFDFTVGGDTFTNADVTTPINAVEVVIYGQGTQMYFDNTGDFTGREGGSLDFDRGSLLLTFEPSYYGPPPLDLFQAVNTSGTHFFGTYGTAVPEPGTSTALLISFSVLGPGAFLRRRITRTATRS
jgi:hypothetical protein